jgi:hypothetical protein
MISVPEIEKIINKINPEASVFQTIDFASDANSASIYLGPKFEDDFREVIQAVYDRIGIVLPCSHETFAVLHELGHIETLNRYDEETIQELTQSYMEDKNGICENDNHVERFYEYTQLEVEQLANDWAVEFMQAYPLFVAELDRTVNNYYANVNESDPFYSLVIDKILGLK